MDAADLDDGFINDIQLMIKKNESIQIALEIYDPEDYADEWEWVKGREHIPEAWRKVLNGEEHNDEEEDEDEVSEYEEEESSSDDDDELDDEWDDEELKQYEDEPDDALPLSLNTHEKATFNKGLNIFKSVSGIATFYPLFVNAMRNGDCSSDLEKIYLESGQYIPPEFINILMLFMAPSFNIELSEDVWLLILEYVQKDAKKLYAEVLKPESENLKEGKSKWMMFRKGVIFYTQCSKGDNIQFSGYQLKDEMIHSRSVTFKYHFGIPNDIAAASMLDIQMLQNDWTKLMPKCDEAVKEILWCMPHAVQLVIMMVMFGKLKDDKAMKLLQSLDTSSIPTMTFIALVGYLLRQHFCREVQKHIPRGKRRRTIDIHFGPKRRTKADQVRVILQLLNGKKVGFNMWPKDMNMDFNEIMFIVRTDMLSLNVMPILELNKMLPWKDAAFDWRSFKFGFYNFDCDYSRYNKCNISLTRGDGLWLTMVQVPKAKLEINNYLGWKSAGSMVYSRHPQDMKVGDIVQQKYHPGLTPELLDSPMHQLPMVNGFFHLQFPKKILRCYVDGNRQIVTPQHFKNCMRELALETLKLFHADAKTVYFCSRMDCCIRRTLVILRMYLQEDSGFAKKSNRYEINQILYRLMVEYRENLKDQNVYDAVRVSSIPGSTYLKDTFPDLNKMIQMQTAEGNDVVGTPLQYMSYHVFRLFPDKGTIAYFDSPWITPSFGAEFSFHTVPIYKRFCLLSRRKLNRIGWLKQNQNMEEQDEFGNRIVTLALVDGKPRVDGKRVSSWDQFLRCLLFLKAKVDVPVINGCVHDENYLQKPFARVYWFNGNGDIMVKTMALNRRSKVLKKRPIYLQSWKNRILEEQNVATEWKPEWGNGALFRAWQARRASAPLFSSIS